MQPAGVEPVHIVTSFDFNVSLSVISLCVEMVDDLQNEWAEESGWPEPANDLRAFMPANRLPALFLRPHW